VGTAYLVARKQGEIDPEIILEFVNTRLARYKLPKEIWFLDSLPRNASGKINKGRVARQVPLWGCSPILGDTEPDLPADGRSGREGTTRRSVED
jgi:fatty-acyl-CoA synthase